MAPALTINSLRLSFVITETILDLLRHDDPDRTLRSIIREPGYISSVNKRQAGEKLPLDLDLPWEHPVGQHFWERYLDQKTPGDADGKLCFEKLVPLRLPKLAEKIGSKPPDLAPSEKAKVRVEGYYFPYGTGLIVTVELTGAFNIVRAEELALAHRYNLVYQPLGAAAGGAGLVNLDELVKEALDLLRERGFGQRVAGRRSDLFSIATVLQGDGVDADKPLVADGPAHRMLNGLANWVPKCHDVPAPVLVKTRLRILGKTSRVGHVLLAGGCGRAVWFPGLFLPQTPPGHGLSCYHRNLTFASLQTDSLLTLVREIQDTGSVNVPSISRLGRLSASLLTRLYTHTRTYNSDSTRAQIAKRLVEVNALREVLGMGLPLDSRPLDARQ